MSNPTGALTVVVGRKSYRLWLGFSGIAALQEKHGSDFITRLQPPEDAGEDWLPDFSVLFDMILESLQRYHSDVADRWLVDEIWSESPHIVGALFSAAFPDQTQSGDAAGNVQAARKA